MTEHDEMEEHMRAMCGHPTAHERGAALFMLLVALAMLGALVALGTMMFGG